MSRITLYNSLVHFSSQTCMANIKSKAFDPIISLRGPSGPKINDAEVELCIIQWVESLESIVRISKDFLQSFID